MTPRLWRAVEELRTLAGLERERWVLWLPVAFGTGISIYFALPQEPPLAFGPAALLAAAAIALTPWSRWRLVTGRFGPALLAFLLAGAGTGSLRTHAVAAPVIARPATFLLEGRVALVEPRGSGLRLLLEELAMDGLAASQTPARVRVTVSTRQPLVPGMRVRLRARLSPPAGPSWSRGYDHARQAWFERLGGIGYSLGELQIVRPVVNSSLADRLAGLRQQVAVAVGTRVGGDAGAVAAALLTGLRGDIPDHVWRAMQGSGLAHLLAISGLHLGLVAGAVFFVARAVFAAIPAVALRVPARKPAALVAFVGAFLYLLLAGAPVPTRRAFVMIAVALLAIVIDRQPFSMRLVALAAAVVLLLQPESVVAVSFQMSFAAVIALVAWFERRPDATDPTTDAADAGLLRRLRDYALLVLITTLLASLATLPFAAFHFQRVATYGVLANLLAVPLTAFWIMPTGLCGLALQPLGLAGPAFDLMGSGVSLLLAIARVMSALPGSHVALAAWPVSALVLCVAGGLWLAIWQRRWRWLGALPLTLGLVIGLAARPPDLLVSPWLDQIALRTEDGRMILHERVRDGFVRQQWQAAMLVQEVDPPPLRAAASADLACDALGCVLDRGEGARIAVVFQAGALAEDCRRADLVITALPVRHCPGPAALIDGPELRRTGGLSLWLEDGGYRLETVAGVRGERPWTHSGG